MTYDAPAVTYYATFLLDLAAEGENRAIQWSVHHTPSPEVKPKTAFVWKVTCDAAGKVMIGALERGKLRVIATARWHGLYLTAFKQAEPNTPTGYQWNLVEAAIRAIQIERAADEPPSPGPIEDIEAIEAKLQSRERDWDDDVGPPPARVPRARVPRARVPSADGSRKRRAVIAIGVIAGTVISLGVVAGVLASLEKTPAKTPPRAPAAPTSLAPPLPKPPPPPKPVTIEDKVGWATSFTQAVQIARPQMTDTSDELGPGEALLARYPKAVWADVDVPAETTVPLVLKDPERERGKHVCASGTIERIERRDVDERRVYVGRLVTSDGDAVAFVALGTTGELVKRSTGTLCGVATGRAGDAAKLVGMFDLPENRTPLVEQ
ncbi:MAG TPA: hypothetical protein VM513_03335 [Kofleriaceae bacterium]|nr:hypothetical protein [Kofleriaceae bacterium]